MNYASAVNNSLRLVYGANIKRFSFSPNFRSLRTRAVVIATSIFNGIVPQKIWSSFATSALASTYGVIDRVDLQQDIISQSAVSSRAAFNLYQSSPDKLRAISVSVVDGSIIPFKNYKIGDDIRVVINRGNVNIDTNLTIRGQEWVGREDGSEEISFDFFNRDQQSYELTPYRAASSLESILRNNDRLTSGLGDQGSESTTGRGPDVEDGGGMMYKIPNFDFLTGGSGSGGETGAEADPGASQGTGKRPFKYNAKGQLMIWDAVKGKYVRG
jgi:hypothetical protein